LRQSRGDAAIALKFLWLVLTLAFASDSPAQALPRVEGNRSVVRKAERTLTLLTLGITIAAPC